jgi:glutathione S-transferase
MAIKFYYSPRTSATRVHWALEEVGVPYEKVRLHLDKGEQKKPEFLAINPNGKVPALVDGDVELFESLAIVFHLGERYGEAKGLWPKAGTKERSLAYAWSMWGLAEVQFAVVQYIQHAGENPRISLPKEKQSKEYAERALANWWDMVQILDARLSGRGHVLGADFTLVDVVLAGMFNFARTMGQLPLGAPNATAWLERCLSRPALARVLGESSDPSPVK